MYITVKQLSNANPAKNRQSVNTQKLLEKAVAIPAKPAKTLLPTIAGIRPYRSAIQPNNNAPQMAPQKKIDWDMVGLSESSQTHSS